MNDGLLGFFAGSVLAFCLLAVILIAYMHPQHEVHAGDTLKWRCHKAYVRVDGPTKEFDRVVKGKTCRLVKK